MQKQGHGPNLSVHHLQKHLHSPCDSIGLVQVEGYIACKNRTRDTQPVITKACYLLKSSNDIEVAKQSAL